MKRKHPTALPPGAKILMTRIGESPAPAKTARRPRYTKPGEDGMNQLERRYSLHLEALRIAGEIHAWAFEPEKFRLALKGDACFYTPDFRVLLNDGTVEFRDTKGFMQEDALIKIKWFVSQHPYPLVVVRWVKGEWQMERFEP
jgi:hypothetical protein